MNSGKSIDLNCDMGESFGIYRVGCDEEIIRYISSANIACGFHAGDPAVMRRTVRLCLEHRVAIGAHPGFQDKEGFGRRLVHMQPDEIHDMMLYQIGALQAILKSEGGELQHVKPHGALYNAAARNQKWAAAIARATAATDGRLILVGPPASELEFAAGQVGIAFAGEAFADRTYAPDGTLTPRDQPQSVIEDEEHAVQQVMSIIANRAVSTTAGSSIGIRARTICIHGDSPHAINIARQLKLQLGKAGIQIEPMAGQSGY